MVFESSHEFVIQLKFGMSVLSNQINFPSANWNDRHQRERSKPQAQAGKQTTSSGLTHWQKNHISPVTSSQKQVRALCRLQPVAQENGSQELSSKRGCSDWFKSHPTLSNWHVIRTKTIKICISVAWACCLFDIEYIHLEVKLQCS